ncbi:MAG: acetate kinase [Weeksellaceae bacterium]|nr:acetate kinase [Weeksellaceae bacterium]
MSTGLVINSGSSSIKFQLIQMPQEKVLAHGLVERIGLPTGAIHTHILQANADEAQTAEYQKTSLQVPVQDHSIGLQMLIEQLTQGENPVLQDIAHIQWVGHRVVHGGQQFTETTLITQEVKGKIRELFPLAPLHNPANLTGIEEAEKLFTNAQQIAVFDTSFHGTIPEYAHRYAIQEKFYQDGIRKYGFHGISHQYVSGKAKELMGEKAQKLITVHLGNGCSITAVENGKSVDTSLGFGPNEGLIMGTRTGAIDQSIIYYLISNYGYTAEEVATEFTKQSGMLALSGQSDMREIEEMAQNGDQSAQLALTMNAYRIKQFIGAFAAAMNGVDGIIFTAGIGENSDMMRAKVCENMEYLGVHLDLDANQVRNSQPRKISTDAGKVEVWVIPTNEEIQIARECANLQA